MTEQLFYEALKPIGQAEFDGIMESGSSDDKRLAAFRAADMIDDYHWLVDRFERLLRAETDRYVLSAAILGVGYIARRFRYADERKLKKMLQPFTNVANPIGEVQDAERDIYRYLSKHRRKRKREMRKVLEALRARS
ncbi:hypothetical protein KX729_02765 [Rhizobium sp. XQZ8]|uniref:hypothetical protein n=1 Tax=Rhizobium populisoli TaxID=2859785 RepID=UPI001CA4E105|nr:hypothetical protein [Rhizobium populisoli]MBW6420351.1 hypothetical protein [Rhizobium populisoli]